MSGNGLDFIQLASLAGWIMTYTRDKKGRLLMLHTSSRAVTTMTSLKGGYDKHGPKSLEIPF